VDPDCFYKITGDRGETVSFYTDADRLERHLRRVSPADGKLIKQLCGWIRKASRMNIPMDKPYALYKLPDIVKTVFSFLPYAGMFKALSNQRMGDFAARFTHPGLRRAFENFLYDKSLPLTGMVFTLSGMHCRSSGYPVGGSMPFTHAIVDRFKRLGGKLHLRSPVEKILTEGGRAMGIRLENGTEVQADYVVSACDLRRTLYTLLEGKHIDPQHEKLFTEMRTMPSCVLVSLGIAKEFKEKEFCMMYQYPVREAISPGGESARTFFFKHYAHDPTLAPEGCTAAGVLYMTEDYTYWENLTRDRAAYQAEKKRIAELTVRNLEYYHPGITEKIECIDVCTPATIYHYTGNWKGRYMTWIGTPEQMKELQTLKNTVPGLKNFYLSGMWMMPPGGLPTAVKTSRDIIHIICHRKGRRFRTEQEV
jgi:phytoene dehydrogenase-like protein